MSAFVIIDVETGRPLAQVNGVFLRTAEGLVRPRIYKSREIAERAFKRAVKKNRLKGVFEAVKYNNSQR